MTSKLAWHLQSVPSWAPGICNSEWIKIIDPGSDVLFPARKVIARLYMPDSQEATYYKRGAAGAVDYFARWRSRYNELPSVWCFESVNEPDVSTPQARQALVDFTVRWVELMHGIGKRTVALSLGVGWTDIGCAPDLARALAETDYWALHEYAAPHMQDMAGWLMLRYRRTVAELQAAGARIPPLLITECGIDGGTAGRPGKGWKTFTDRAGYLSQLAWYDKELQRDSYVEAATIFTSGPNWDWADFDVDQQLSQMLAAYIDAARDTPPPPPVVPPEPPPVVQPPAALEAIRTEAWRRLGVPLNPGFALATKAREAGLGAPLSGEFAQGCYTCQLWAGGITYCVTGQWDRVEVLTWL